MKFELSTEQVKKAIQFKELFPHVPTAIGGAFTYSFTPTSIGDIVKIKHVSGKSLDLTENL